MARSIRRQLSFANVASAMALVFSMSGAAYAFTLPKNSISSKHIKTGAVAASDLHSNAVTSKKVKNGSLKTVDFAAGQIPAGAKGAQGIQGIQGPPGVVGTVTVVRKDFTVGTSPSSTINAICPAGTRAIGGGAEFGSGASDIALITSTPIVTNNVTPADGGTFNGWNVAFSNPDHTGTASASAYALCAQT